MYTPDFWVCIKMVVLFIGRRVSIFRKKSVLKVLNDVEVTMLTAGCSLYVQCMETFPLLATDILVGLSCNGGMISNVWHALNTMSCLKEKQALKLLTLQSQHHSSLSVVLSLAIQATQYLIA